MDSTDHVYRRLRRSTIAKRRFAEMSRIEKDHLQTPCSGKNDLKKKQRRSVKNRITRTCSDSGKLVGRKIVDIADEKQKLFPIFRVNLPISNSKTTEMTNDLKEVSDMEIDLHSGTQIQSDISVSILRDASGSDCSQSVKSFRKQCGNSSEVVILTGDGGSESCFVLGNDQDPLYITKNLEDQNISEECFPLQNHCGFEYYGKLNSSETDITNKYYVTCGANKLCMNAPSWNNVVGVVDHECKTNLRKHESKHKIVSKCFKKSSLGSNVLPSDLKGDMGKEIDSDLMWSDQSKGHWVQININDSKSAVKIKEWMLEWKEKSTKFKEKCDGNSYDYSDSDDDDFGVHKALLITGLPGVGKTFIVNNIAREFGFKVLEVNASSARSGGHILSQLREAFQSYHVDNKHVTFKIMPFSSSLPFGDNVSLRPHVLNSDVTEEKRRKISLIAASSENILSVKSCDKQSLSGRSQDKQTIKSMFAQKNLTGPEHIIANTTESRPGVKLLKERKITDFVSQGKILKPDKLDPAIEHCDTRTWKKLDVANDFVTDKSKCTISNLTLILFDDVDVIFDSEDAGFWLAVNSFLKTSKKPVIFTASRNIEVISYNISENFQILNMCNPIMKSHSRPLSSKCCTSNVFIKSEFLNDFFANDIRRSLLNLQFWCKTLENNFQNESALKNEKGGIDDIVHSSSESCLQLTNASSSCNPLYFHHLTLKHLYDSSCMESLKRVLHCYSYGWDIIFRSLYKPLKSASSQAIASDVSDLPVICSIHVKKMDHVHVFCSETSTDNSISVSTDLSQFQLLVDELSFSDVLKGQLCSGVFYWRPVAERVKWWSSGLPTSVDHVWEIENLSALELVSLVDILAARKIKEIPPHNSNDSSEPNLVDDLCSCNQPFELMHNSLTNADQLKAVSSALPVNQRLRTREVYLDYLSCLKYICKIEEIRKNDNQKRGRRFLHYFDAIAFLVDHLKMS